MCQPRKWLGWLPILALAALWFIANAFFKADPIKADLESRAAKAAVAAAGSVAGLRPVGVDVAGRDVTLRGDVTATDIAGKVATVVDNEYGVRLVNGAPTVVTAVRPYTWSASRDGGKITLTGHVPDEAVKLANARAAAAAFPNAQVDDQQMVAFGAPAGFAAASGFLLPELAKLGKGKLALSDMALCAEGEALSAESFVALNGRLASLPAGLTRQAAQGATCNLSAPAAAIPAPVAAAPVSLPPVPPPPPPAPAPVVVPPPPPVAVAPPPPPPPPPPPVAVAPPPPPPPPVVLEWTAQKTSAAVALSGMAPNEAAVAALRTGAAALAPAVSDAGLRVVPNLKTEPNFGQATQFALAQLRPLTSGTATLRDTVLTVTGVAPTPEVKAAIEAAMRGGLPSGLRSATADIAVRPYVFQARSEGGNLVLEGLVPDLATRNAINAYVAVTPFAGKVRDATQLVSAAPAGFADTAILAVQNLLRMDDGAVRIVDQAVTFYGTTCKPGVKEVAETGLKVNLAAGFTSSALVEVKKPAACGVCLADLAKLGGQEVKFLSGRAELLDDKETKDHLDLVAGILKQCPQTRIEVQGHTDNDGEDRGYDNKGLSERRARTVVEAMGQRGIPVERLSPRGFGATAPIVPHNLPGAKAKNRRVQFVPL